MKRNNIDIIDLSVGEPDFSTPFHIKQAAIKAIQNNFTKYTLNTGIIELRQAIVEKLKKDNHLEYDIDEIIISNGAKQCIFNAVLSLVNPGDEVLIPSPYWVSHPEIVNLAQGRPVFIPTREENGYKLTAAQLHDHITPHSKLLILCNPNNPTGSVYSKEELEELAEVIEKKDIYLVADEIYEKLIYDRVIFFSIAAISPKMKEKTIIVNGVSKAYAMTGWRIGYAAGNKELIAAAAKIQSHSTTNASSVSQYASLEALIGPQDAIEKMRMEFAQRRNFVLNELIAIEGITCPKPVGAFYAFPNVSFYYGNKYKNYSIDNSNTLADYLLHDAKVAVIPGVAFGCDNHIRLSYATSSENLQKGLERLHKGFARLIAKKK